MQPQNDIPHPAIAALSLTFEEQQRALDALPRNHTLTEAYAAIATAQLRKVIVDALNVDASEYADYIVRTMPSGMDGFIREWGFDQFTAALIGRMPRLTPAKDATDLSRRLDTIPPAVVMAWGLLRYAHETTELLRSGVAAPVENAQQLHAHQPRRAPEKGSNHA